MLKAVAKVVCEKHTSVRVDDETAVISQVIWVWKSRVNQGGHLLHLGPNSTWLVTSLHDITPHVRHVEPMHFGCVELVEQRSSTS